MNYFKVGDKLRLKFDGLGPNIPADSVLTCIEDDEPVDGFRLSGKEVSIRWANSHKDYFELIIGKESPAKWLKENKWWIKCESQAELDLINPWLKENFGDTLGVRVPDIIRYVCNDFAYPNLVFWGYEDKPKNQEITLEFKTIVKSFTLPAVETEQEKKIRELQETIDKASAQIKAIKEGM